MKQQSSDRKKEIGMCLALTAIFFVLYFVIVPKGYLYGSEVDWLSQHVNLAETLRDEMLRQKTPFLDFIWLGGGNNVFDFSYYGYLRPDVLIGCILPNIAMKMILTVCMIVSFLATVLLCYYWMRTRELEPEVAFFGAFLCMTAACLFQFHRQIMFVNYMPFLMLALILAKRTLETRKILLYCMILTVICYQSYYYAIACFLVIGLYWLQLTQKGKDLLFLIKIMALSGCAAGLLFLPTFLALLENKRASGGAGAPSLLIPHFQIRGLLYNPYGIGVSVIVLYLIVYGLFYKKYRIGSLGYLLLFCIPVIPYILNGTLYTRTKILIPFLPLILLHGMTILQEMWKGNQKASICIGIGLSVFLIYYLINGKMGSDKTANRIMLLDIAIVLLFCILQKWKNKRLLYLMLMATPLLNILYVSSEEEFVPEEKGDRIFTEQEMKEQIGDQWYRTDYLTEPLANVNQIEFAGQKSTGMYSSVSNQRYSEYYHDIMKTPIRINNRVALLPEINPYLEYMMGVRYVVTQENKIPYGYHTIYKKDDTILAENENVLPMAYLSMNTMERESFDKETFPDTLKTLMEYTIVEDVPSKNTENEGKVTEELPADEMEDRDSSEKESTVSKTAGEQDERMKDRSEKNLSAASGDGYDWKITDSGQILLKLKEKPDTITFEETEDGVMINAEEECACSYYLEGDLSGKIGVMCFDVESRNGDRVTITVNESRNRLSAKNATYPNENERFTYFLDETMENVININYSKGKYVIRNLTFDVLPAPDRERAGITEVNYRQTEGKEILHCEAVSDEDCCFVTSIPYQNGMRITVDGKTVGTKIVNTAFVGTWIEKGTHDVSIYFDPPGKRAGMLLSVIAFLVILLSDIGTIRKGKRV